MASTCDLQRSPFNDPALEFSFAQLRDAAARQRIDLGRPLPAGAYDDLARAPDGDEAARIATSNGVPRLVPKWLQQRRAAAATSAPDAATAPPA